jgi:hypothetical protein
MSVSGRIADNQPVRQHRWMTSPAKIKLSRLREIGWSLWDPIGLRDLSDGDWQDGGPCADEYDGYLLQVVSRLRRGQSTSIVTAYLEGVETSRMGLTPTETTRSRAHATVGAIAAYLAALSAGPLKVR